MMEDEPKYEKREQKTVLHRDLIKSKLLENYVAAFGNISKACRMTGIERRTYYHLIAEDPTFAEELKAIEPEEMAIDFAEEKLKELMDDGNPAAVIFFLKTKGKQRGYIETQQHQIQGLAKIEFINVSQTNNSLLEDQGADQED
jgi:hypothetical protein